MMLLENNLFCHAFGFVVVVEKILGFPFSIVWLARSSEEIRRIYQQRRHERPIGIHQEPG
jgi:hypothetical protein